MSSTPPSNSVSSAKPAANTADDLHLVGTRPEGLTLETTTKPKKPCRVCDSFKSWRKHEAKHERQQARMQHGSASSSTATLVEAVPAVTSTAVTAVGSVASAGRDGQERMECPPDSQILGRATWTFLHTMAAYYPDRPTANQQNMMRSLLNSFSHFYPCEWCASHMREEMKKEPPVVNSRWGLSQWMCQLHNKVNVIQGKDEFDCSKVDERWRDGPKDGSCD
ncbi:Flavin-linked sulfhydryl oxidase of the mitochondrial IMS [Spiromyces aspiralis]|uniref:Flavin-linked sulfhydryl oxidase of the mitochondrial IMS n=1 Tax=Spiromyces aspiralis TaxID=68401 RepID=A0ACC1HVV2_9FUNG|nr:Flavin-linked sulfhydryl oxidase of the mitochondrial IMS [Spiromyces aspiralis]